MWDILPKHRLDTGNYNAEIAMYLVLDHVLNYNGFMFNLFVQSPVYLILLAFFYAEEAKHFRNPLNG